MQNLKKHINRRTILSRWAALAFLLMATTSCHQEELDFMADGTDGQQPALLPDGAITISPLDQTLDMAVWGCDSTAVLAPVSSVSVATPEADFLMPIGTQHLYIEQNDDRQWRTATVTVSRTDGTQQQLTLAQPPAIRASQQDVHRSFLRHHAVGYSYDAVGGEYCNLNYVRCQLLNRMVVDAVQEKEVLPLINVSRTSELRAAHYVCRSFTEYAQNTNFKANASGQIMFAFKGEVDVILHAFEDGTIESYIIHDERVLPKVRYTLQADEIGELVQQYPNMLTSSFRKALKNLAATPVNDWRAVDEFLEVYGTHMVVDAELGGRVDLDLQVETHKYNDIISDSLMAEASLAGLFKVHMSQEQSDSIWEVARQCKCKLDVVGGDLSILDHLVSMTTFASEDIEVNPDDLDRWINSVYFNDDDIENSNVELTEMQVVPIWYLVADQTLRDRIEARVYSNAAAMQKLLGNRNFINVKIPYSTTKYTCRVGSTRYTINDPDVTDVIVGGRYVATICKEIVPNIDKKNKVRVVYPIYEGHVKLSQGLCVYNHNAYKVDWSNHELEVEDLGPVGADGYDGNIYMNFGNLSTQQMPYTDYLDGHLVVGVERPGGIGTDGKLQGSPVRVVKYFNHFYLNNKNRYDNLPNWSYATTLPDEACNFFFSDYFDETTWKDRMRRNDDYTYIFNITELGYE